MPKLSRRYLPLYIIASFLLVVGIASGSFIYAYSDTYYPRVEVSGIKLGGKSKTEGEQLVKQSTEKYINHKFVLSVPDISKPREAGTNRYPEIEMTTSAKELGLSFQTDYVLREAWRVGHTSSLRQWIGQTAKAFWYGSKQNLPYTVNNDLTTTYIHTNVRPKIKVPQPAGVKVDGDKVIIVDPEEGMEVDEQALTKMIIDRMDNVQEEDTSYLRVPVKFIFSDVTRKTVEPLSSLLDKVGNTSYQLKVTYQEKEQTAAPNRAQRLQWYNVVQDDKGQVNIAVNDDAVDKYLRSSKLPIDYKKSATAMNKALVQHLTNFQKGKEDSSLSIGLVAKTVAKPVEPGVPTLGKYEGKYIEVNLTDQKLYLITGSTLEKTYRVSSGKWSTPTPTGEYTIGMKNARAYSASYKLYMPYWMSFLRNEYGLHELPEWPNGIKEGAAHIGTPVSHGCVRLGQGDAKEVYDWTPSGTPLYIHK